MTEMMTEMMTTTTTMMIDNNDERTDESLSSRRLVPTVIVVLPFCKYICVYKLLIICIYYDRLCTTKGPVICMAQASKFLL